MTERNNRPEKEQQNYGTSTEGEAAPTPDYTDNDDAMENPLGFNAETDRIEETSVETLDEGERTSVEEI